MVVVVCGSQMSKTEGIFNIMGHRLDEGPYSPVLYIGPTEKLVKSMAADRWQKVLRTTKALFDRLAKGQLNKTVEQFVGGIRCGWGWAGSPSELAGHPAGLVLVDERSRMRGDVGGEGDPVGLAEARTKNYPNRKIGVMSTPTIEGGDPTWELFEESAMHFWSWKCKHCSERFIPRLALLVYPEGATPSEAAESARVVCPSCGGEHETIDRENLNKSGVFVEFRHKTEQEPADIALFGKYMPADQPSRNPAIGYWISGLCSPWPSFGDIAQVLCKAYRSKNDEKLQVAINTWGGELFRLKGDAPAWSEVDACKRHYPRGSWLPGAVFLTLGADVQKRGIYYVVRAWGYNSTSWLVDDGYLTGETEFDAVWVAMGELLRSTYRDMPIRRAFIDSGYRPGDEYRRPDHAVYTFCRRHHGIAFPTKGYAEAAVPVRSSLIDYNVGGKVIKNGIRLFHIDTDHFKRWLHGRVRWPSDDEPGGWYLHEGIGEEYCRQIVSEEMIIKPSGNRVWIKNRRQNHFLDCEILAYCAAKVEGVDKIKKPAGPEDLPEVRQTDRAASKQKRPESLIRRSTF